MRKKIIRGILLVLLAAFVIIQFFRFDKSNPPIDAQQDYYTLAQPPAEVAQLLEAACNDCHSHATKYPWYTNIAPVSWWIQGHIDNGREELNFSEIASYPQGKFSHKMEECAEMLREKEMPLLSYMIMHNDAWLSDEERERMAVFFEALSQR